MKKIPLLLCFLCFTSVMFFGKTTLAAKQPPNDYLVTKCTHGLYEQPLGTFSVFFSCDDALGNNIGIVNILPAASPGKIKLEGAKSWSWSPIKRFWQDPKWAADVTGFAWSPSGRYLYVATSSIYGTGVLFELNLVTRSFRKIFPKKGRATKDIVFVRIESFDLKLLKMNVSLVSHETKEIITSEVLNIKK